METRKYSPLTLTIGLLLLAVLALAGCVRQVAPAATDTPESTNLLDEVLDSTAEPTEIELQPEPSPTATEAPPTPTDPPAPTNTLHIITPTNTPAATAESTAAGSQTPEAAVSATPQPTSAVPQIDPDQEFTGAHHVDSMDEVGMWTDQSGILPDNEYIKLEILDGVMAVTGKRRLWDTWWISGFTQTDFYIEMEVNTGDCNPDDAYGMIVRASQHGEPTRGYLIGFTCAGEAFARRLESASPYVAVSILNPTETDLIYAGKDQTNILGVLLDGSSITLYPNRRYFTTIEDSAFACGRYGIFVSAGDAGSFTFTIDEIRTWGVE